MVFKLLLRNPFFKRCLLQVASTQNMDTMLLTWGAYLLVDLYLQPVPRLSVNLDLLRGHLEVGA